MAGNPIWLNLIKMLELFVVPPSDVFQRNNDGSWIQYSKKMLSFYLEKQQTRITRRLMPRADGASFKVARQLINVNLILGTV